MVREIIDSAVAHQFRKYLKAKGKDYNDATYGGKNEDEDDDEQGQSQAGNNQGYGPPHNMNKRQALNLIDTVKELKEESEQFVKDKYPGAKKPPHLFVELMASENASRTLRNLEWIMPEEKKENRNCDRHQAVK